MRARLLTFASLALAGTFAAGCGGGGGGSSSRKAQGASATTSGTISKPTSGSINGNGSGVISLQQPGALVIESVAQVASQTEQAMKPGPIVGLAFKLAGSGSRVVLSELELTNSGTMDESLLGEARLYEDRNGNAEVDTSDVLLGTAARVAQNDAAYVFTGMTAAIDTGTRPQYVVTVDTAPLASQAAVAYVGSTLSLSIANNMAIKADDLAARAVTPTGSFPISANVVLEINDTALISEIVTGLASGSTSSEYIELFNATGKSIDLTNYYLTDFTEAVTQNKYYWKLPTGADFLNSTRTPSDFIVRFPAGATLAPGKVITVAIDGGGYKAFHGKDADYRMRNGSNAATTAVQMLTWNGQTGAASAFVSAPVPTGAGLTGSSNVRTEGGEALFFIYWDGVSDLVKDVDIVYWGSGSAENTVINKSPNQRTTGGGPSAPEVKVDSVFDTDTTESVYLVETADNKQADLRAPMGLSITRFDFLEGNEKKTNGNGLTGHDETSEDCGDGQGGAGTFDVAPASTPGRLR